MQIHFKNKIFIFFLFIGIITIKSQAQTYTNFNTGNIVVLQVGANGSSTALSSVGTTISLKEYNTNSVGQTVATDSVIMPISGANRLVNSGSASSEGQINLSADSNLILVAGYDTTIGYVGVSSSTAATVGRAIDTVNFMNTVGRAAKTNTYYSANNIRSAVKAVTNDYYSSGASIGNLYFGYSVTTPTPLTATVTNARVMKIFNGNLYYSAASGANFGIFRYNGLPTSSAIPTQLINTATSSSPYSFAINSTETIVYIADDRTTIAGGIQKWVYNSTTASWGAAAADTFSVGAATGARGLTVDWSGTYPILYATTTDNRLIKMIDSGMSTASYIVLAIAPTNTAFRSVCFSPKCTAPNLTAAVTNPNCSGSTASVVLNTFGGSPISSYAWTGPNSFSANTQNISNLTAKGTYHVTVTTIGGCTQTANAVITIPNALNTVLSNNAPLCSTDTLKLRAISTGGTGTLSVNWTGPNSFTSSILNTNIIHPSTAASGWYYVTTTDANSCTRVDSIMTNIYAVPTTITPTVVNPTCFAPNGSISLAVIGGSSPLTYAWTGPNSFTSTNQNIAGLTVAGSYHVTVTAGGICSTIATASLTVPNTVLSNIVASNAPLCSTDTLKLYSNPSGGTGTLSTTWTGPNTFTATTNNTILVHPSASASGLYVVTVSDVNGCTKKDSLNVSVFNAPTALLLTPNNPLCSYSSGAINLTVTGGSSPLTFSWSGPLSFAANTQNINSLMHSGVYKVTVTSGGICSKKDSTSILFPLPIMASISSNSPICTGDSLKLFSNNISGGTGVLSSSWTGVNNFTSTSNNPLIAASTVANSGQYKLIITDANNCTYKDSMQTVVQPPVNVTLGNDTSICQGSPLLLNTPAVLGYHYHWNTGDTTATLFVSNAGTYSVMVTTPLGCHGTDSLNIIVDSLPYASNIVATLTSGTTYTFNVNNPHFATAYQWFYGDGSTDTGASPTHTYTQTGTVNVKVVLSNRCGTDTLSKTLTNVAVNGLVFSKETINCFPNPVISGNTVYFNKTVNCEIYNLTGQELKHYDQVDKINQLDLPIGLYIVKTNFGVFKLMIK